MKGLNQNRALFDAITDLDDDLIVEAAAPRMLPWPVMAKRIAAVAAVVAILLAALLWPASDENYVTGPGLLVVRAYAVDEDNITDANSTILKEGVELPFEYYWCPAMSVGPSGVPLKFSLSEEEYPDKSITFEIFLDGGSFLQPNPDFDWRDYINLPEWTEPDIPANFELSGHFTVENNEVLYWQPRTYVKDPITNETIDSFLPDGPSFYADIIIRADDHIVGYAVVEFFQYDRKPYSEGGIPSYSACVLVTASFPKVEGEYQNISTDYMSRLFEKIHETN